MGLLSSEGKAKGSRKADPSNAATDPWADAFNMD